MPDQLPADAGITVEDLPFDLEPDDEGGAPPYSNTADDDIEPDDHADAAFEFGQAFENTIVELYRLAVVEALAHQGNKPEDKDAREALQQGVKWNPKHLIRASRLFPDLFNEYNTVNSTDLFAAFRICSKCKDDFDAVREYEWWETNTPTLGQLGEHLKGQAARAERGKTPTLAERCAVLVREWHASKEPYSMQRAAELAALPEVARVLERKESDGKAE